jgi:hypothetical protein
MKRSDPNQWAEQKRIDRLLEKGYRGFASKKAYEAHYSDPANYADEIQAMEDYTRESAQERAIGETLDAGDHNQKA